MDIACATEPNLSVGEFREVLIASTLAERRPVHDLERLEQMLSHAEIIVTARDQGRLGVYSFPLRIAMAWDQLSRTFT